MSITLRSALAYLIMFLAMELPAYFRASRLSASLALLGAAVIVIILLPLLTFSNTVDQGEAWWWPVGLFVAGIMFVLLGHFELHWSARWLIVSAMGVAAALLSHFIAEAIKR